MQSCLICDDHAMMLDALASSVGMHWPEAALTLVGDFPAAWRAAGKGHDLILCDLGMPGATPLDGIARMREIAPDALLIVVTANEEDSLLVRLFELGIAGFIPKSSSGAIVEAAIRLVLAGGRYLPARVIELLGSDLSSDQPTSKNTGAAATVRDASTRGAFDISHLSERQMTVLRLMSHGYSNKEIARQVDLSPATVKAYVAIIIGVLGVGNRTAAAFRARELGLL